MIVDGQPSDLQDGREVKGVLLPDPFYRVLENFRQRLDQRMPS